MLLNILKGVRNHDFNKDRVPENLQPCGGYTDFPWAGINWSTKSTVKCFCIRLESVKSTAQPPHGSGKTTSFQAHNL